jgi:mxaD protein
MNKLMNISVLSGLALLAACAHKPMHNVAELVVVEKVTINASADKVWAKAQNFGDLGAWHPAVAKTEIIGGVNNQPGAVRLLTLQDGGTINETLTAYNASGRTLSYVINEGVLPVSNYASTLTVSPLGASASEVTWAANFKRKDLSANPATGQDDKAASETITAVFQGGLANLKKITE